MSKISQEDYTKALETINKFHRQCSKCGTQFGDRWDLTIASGKDLPFRLCPKCHREFVKLVDDFFLNRL